VLALLAELNRETGVTVLLATHAADVAAAATRVLRMRDGRFEPGNPKKGLPPPWGSPTNWRRPRSSPAARARRAPRS
jgi:energy-coupling factor transporter ATP-binding protein EcfA2